MGRPSNVGLDLETGNSRSSRSRCSSWASLIVWCAIGYCCMLVILIDACFPDFSLLKLGLLPSFVQGSSPALFYAFSESPRQYSKPKGVEIVALVPFHDPRQTEILDCYLQKNLASSGGFLDRVVFVSHSIHTESLEWLTSLVNGTSSYAVSNIRDDLLAMTGGDTSTMFVWIDGDVVFFEDHTIPTIVKTKMDRTDALVVSANVVNQAALARLHSHPSIALPYLPELQPAQSADHDIWRASTLPQWKGPAGFQVQKGFSPLSKGHRWLPTDDEMFDQTPIGRSIYSDDGPGSEEWTVKAQQHYSFLHHLELGDLHRYRFPIWNNPTDSISTSFFCFMGRDARTVELFMRDDTSEMALKSSRDGNHRSNKIVIDGKGIVAQFSDHGSPGLGETDVLQRYRAFAREMVC